MSLKEPNIQKSKCENYFARSCSYSFCVLFLLGFSWFSPPDGFIHAKLFLDMVKVIYPYLLLDTKVVGIHSEFFVKSICSMK